MGSIKKNLQDHIENLSVSIPLVVSGQMLGNNLGDRAEKVIVHLKIAEEYPSELTMSYRNNVNH